MWSAEEIYRCNHAVTMEFCAGEPQRKGPSRSGTVWTSPWAGLLPALAGVGLRVLRDPAWQGRCLRQAGPLHARCTDCGESPLLPGAGAGLFGALHGLLHRHLPLSRSAVLGPGSPPCSRRASPEGPQQVRVSPRPRGRAAAPPGIPGAVAPVSLLTSRLCKASPCHIRPSRLRPPTPA